jgi:hypothetical protein
MSHHAHISSDVFNDVFTYPVFPPDGGEPCVGVEMYNPQPLAGFDPETGERFVRLLSPDDARLLARDILRAADEARAA